jgi:hypothetical protein
VFARPEEGATMSELESAYVDRRNELFERARNLIRTDPAGFTEAGRKLSELFPAERAIEIPQSDDPEDGIARFSVFQRIASAASVAANPDLGDQIQRGWFEFNNFRDGTEKQLSARLITLAILLGSDDHSHEVITPEMCELGTLPYETDDWAELGRVGVDWIELGWPHGDDPSPSVLDRLARAISWLTPKCAQPIARADFAVTTDLRATSDLLWQHLFAFRRKLMEGGAYPPAEWYYPLMDISNEAHEAGLRPHFEVEYIAADLSMVRKADPHGFWDGVSDGWGKVVLAAFGETGVIELHDLSHAFDDHSEPDGKRKRLSAIEWAEGWMNARERQLCLQPSGMGEQDKTLIIPAGKPGGYTAKELREEAGRVADMSPSTFGDIRKAAGIQPSAKAGQHFRYNNAQIRKLAKAVQDGGIVRGKHKTFRNGNAFARVWLELIPSEQDSSP